MKSNDSRALKVGDRVAIFAGQANACAGTVKANNPTCVCVAWDDGQAGYIAHLDADCLIRAEKNDKAKAGKRKS